MTKPGLVKSSSAPQPAVLEDQRHQPERDPDRGQVEHRRDQRDRHAAERRRTIISSVSSSTNPITSGSRSTARARRSPATRPAPPPTAYSTSDSRRARAGTRSSRRLADRVVHAVVGLLERHRQRRAPRSVPSVGDLRPARAGRPRTVAAARRAVSVQVRRGGATSLPGRPRRARPRPRRWRPRTGTPRSDRLASSAPRGCQAGQGVEVGRSASSCPAPGRRAAPRSAPASSSAATGCRSTGPSTRPLMPPRPIRRLAATAAGPAGGPPSGRAWPAARAAR